MMVLWTKAVAVCVVVSDGIPYVQGGAKVGL